MARIRRNRAGSPRITQVRKLRAKPVDAWMAAVQSGSPRVNGPVRALGAKIPLIPNETTFFEITIDTEELGGTGSATKVILLPVASGAYTFDWSDGVDSLNTHTYSAGGVKTITSDDVISTLRFNNGGDKLKLNNVTSLGAGFSIGDSGSFYGCANMTWSAIDAPRIATTNLSNTFFDAQLFNGNIGNWQIRGVASLAEMFFGAFAYTGAGISKWDVSTVTSMSQLFFACYPFNEDISGWDVSNVTNMNGLVRSCTIFNQDIGGWDVGNVTSASHLLASANAFNQYIGNWDVSNIQTMHAMLGSTSFNQPLTNWLTNALVDASYMLAGATSFDQDISHFNMSSVTTTDSMLKNATAFDQDLTGWDLGEVLDMDNMLDNCGMSQANYDLFLIMLDGQTLQSTLNIGALNMTYTAAGAGGTARASLIGKGHTISGDISG